MAKWCFLLLLASTLSSCDYYLINAHKFNVGHIEKSNIGGDEDFKVCFDEAQFISRYSRDKVGFKHGIDSLRTFFSQHYDSKGITGDSGYITLRFLINCKGESGRYEVLQVASDYTEKEFHPQIINQIVALTRSLEEWTAFGYDDAKYDSHTHLTFKIDNGQLTEILL